MNKIKKEIYNLAREYAKGYLTGNLGKVVEEEDKLICYVNKNKIKKDYFGYTIICKDVRKPCKDLANAYKLNKPIVYVISGLEFKKDNVNIYGHNDCKVIISDCKFHRGVKVDVDGECMIRHTIIENSIFKRISLFADRLTLQDMYIDNFLHLAGCDLSIFLGAKENLTVIDSFIGRLNQRTNVSMHSENRMIINNSKMHGNHVNCESSRIATYQNSEFMGGNSVDIKTDSFNRIKVTAPTITLNGNEIDTKNKPVRLKPLTDSLSLKRLEVIALLKQLSDKCSEVNEKEISRYSEEVKNHTIKKTLTK